MDEKALFYNKQGLRLAQNDRFQEAIDFFTKAIEIDPSYPDPYLNRGETYILLNRLVEGNTDIKRAKDLRSGLTRLREAKKQSKKPSANISISEVDSIYDSLFPSSDEDYDDNPLDFDDSFYDHVFTDEAIESEDTWNAITQPATEKNDFPAILEFIGGEREEVAGAILFTPTPNDISLTREDGYVERVIPLEQLLCIRTTSIPGRTDQQCDSSCQIEIIETIDGSIFHEAILPVQDNDYVLFGFSTKEQTPFPYTLIPTVNIKERCQQRHLGDILLEKRFIANDILKQALDEHQQEKSMKLGKIIAQKSQVLYSTIEKELEKAKKGNIQGLKTGEILLASGLVNEDQILDALEHQENIQKMKIGQFLIEKGIIQEKEVYMALAEKFRIPFVDLRKQKVSKKTLTFLSKDFVLQNEILPISLEKDVLTVASLNPNASSMCEKIVQESKCQNVKCVLAQPTHLRNIINLLYKRIGLGK